MLYWATHCNKCVISLSTTQNELASLTQCASRVWVPCSTVLALIHQTLQHHIPQNGNVIM